MQKMDDLRCDVQKKRNPVLIDDDDVALILCDIIAGRELQILDPF